MEIVVRVKEDKVKKAPISVTFLTPDNLKIKECSISLERLSSHVKEEETEIEEEIKIENIESIEETEDTFDGIKDYFSLDETQKSLVSDIVGYQHKTGEANKSYECPKCKFKFDSRNKLKLHIDALHDKFGTKIRCPLCQVILYGSGYERHVNVYHPEALQNEEYILSPKPYVTPIKPQPGKGGVANIEENIVTFNVENPWDEIVSESGRQKRSIDADLVRKARKKCPPQRYEYKGEVRENERKGQIFKISPDYLKLRQKLDFLSNLDLNSFYKKFQQCYKSIKISKKLIETYKVTLNSHEQDLLRQQLVRQETQLIKLCKEQIELKSNLLHGSVGSSGPFHIKHIDYMESVINERLNNKNLIKERRMEKWRNGEVSVEMPSNHLLTQNLVINKRLNEKKVDENEAEDSQHCPTSSNIDSEHFEEIFVPAKKLMPHIIKRPAVKSLNEPYCEIDSSSAAIPKIKIYRESDLKIAKPRFSSGSLLKQIAAPKILLKQTSGNSKVPFIPPKHFSLNGLVQAGKTSSLLFQKKVNINSAMKIMNHQKPMTNLFYQVEKPKFVKVQSTFQPVKKTIDNNLFDEYKIKSEPSDSELKDPLSFEESQSSTTVTGEEEGQANNTPAVIFRDISDKLPIILNVSSIASGNDMLVESDDQNKKTNTSVHPNILKKKRD